MELLSAAVFGWPAWLWLAFVAVVVALLAFDLGALHRDDHEVSPRESLLLSALYIGAGVAFSGAVWALYFQAAPLGGLDPALAVTDPALRARTAAELYLTGFVVEKTLALDDVFVISLIFGYFGVPELYQHRLLVWGVVGVVVLRAIMIGLGAALVSRFEWVLYVFGAFLI